MGKFNSDDHYIYYNHYAAGAADAAAAAATKSLQSCPTLCGPIDGSPPGSSIPGILQARTLDARDQINQCIIDSTFCIKTLKTNL